MQTDNILYSLPYLLIFFFLFVLWGIEEFRLKQNIRNNIDIRLITALVILLFIGLRGFVYTDWTSYYPVYEELPSLWDFDYDALNLTWERGFVLYAVVFKTLGFNYFGWVFISNLIDIVVLYLLFKQNTKYFVIAFIAFFIYSGVGIEFNLMRNSKSIILFLLSIPYLRTKRFFPYLLLNLLGSFFHVSSLLYILLYPLLNRRIPIKIYLLIFIIGNILFLFRIELMRPVIIKISELFNNRAATQLLMYMESGFYKITLGYVERFFFFIILMCFYKKIQKGTSNNVYLNMYLIYFVLFFYFAEFSIIGERLSMLFVVSYWFLIPLMYSYSSKSVKVYFFLILLIYGSLKIIVGNDTITCKYDNLIFGIDSYENRLFNFNNYYIGQ